jgi:hypothetical protein
MHPKTSITVSLHPHLHLALPPDAVTCTHRQTHLSVTLPDGLFLDPTELARISSSASILSAQSIPKKIDIERPSIGYVKDHDKDALQQQQQEIQLHLLQSSLDQELRLDIPLHARYLPPSSSGYSTISLFSNDDSGCVRALTVCDDASVPVDCE